MSFLEKNKKVILNESIVVKRTYCSLKVFFTFPKKNSEISYCDSIILIQILLSYLL